MFTYFCLVYVGQYNFIHMLLCKYYIVCYIGNLSIIAGPGKQEKVNNKKLIPSICRKKRNMHNLVVPSQSSLFKVWHSRHCQFFSYKIALYAIHLLDEGIREKYVFGPMQLIE